MRNISQNHSYGAQNEKNNSKKSHGAGVLNVIFTLFGLGVLCFGLWEGSAALTLVPLLVIIICGYRAVTYITLPNILITYEDNSIILPKNQVIPLKDILDVSYVRAHSRNGQYRYGTVTVETHLERFTVRLVSECEEVSKELTHLMYEARYSGAQGDELRRN